MSQYLKSGFTTGTCAAAAAKAAVFLLNSQKVPEKIDIVLPEKTVQLVPEYVKGSATFAEAAIRKDAGDDPDITHQSLIIAKVEWAEGKDINLKAGDGIGVVTKQGLSVPPGQPAINPTPRGIIINAVRGVIGNKGLTITFSIPGGEELAKKTFNPRLGIVGGLSILGTTGIVRPFSLPAIKETLKCSLDVAAANNVTEPFFVPGHIGFNAAKKLFSLHEDRIIEVGNEWGFILDEVLSYSFKKIFILGHPGKIAKLAMNEWDTHSSRSKSALPYVLKMVEKLFEISLENQTTVEGVFNSLSKEKSDRLGKFIAEKIEAAVIDRLKNRVGVKVLLICLKGRFLGSEEWFRLSDKP